MSHTADAQLAVMTSLTNGGGKEKHRKEREREGKETILMRNHLSSMLVEFLQYFACSVLDARAVDQ